jgi:DNA replication protein DnaC
LDVYKELNRWRLDVKYNVYRGKGLFLYSETKGNGKTSWACKILNEYLKKVCLTNNLKCRGIFVNVPDFLQGVRNEISTDGNDMHELVDHIKEADIVVWDDIGVEKPSDWVREQLYILINYRESNNLSQVYTSNINLSTLQNEKYLGGRIVSRINGQCDKYEFKGDDRRESV